MLMIAQNALCGNYLRSIVSEVIEEGKAAPIAAAKNAAIKADQLKSKLKPMIERWAKGEITLKDIKGYTDEELYAIASQGYTFFLQGKTEPARVIFEGLVAIDPTNPYYYRGLGVIYLQLKDLDKALKQFNYAIRLAPNDMVSYINRAEIYMAMKQYSAAEADLDNALSRAGNNNRALVNKANAMLRMLPE